MSLFTIMGTGRPLLNQTYAASAQQTVLNLSSLSGYRAGVSDVTVTINAGVYMWSNTNAAPGLKIVGAAGDTVKIINNGNIIGMGGAGGEAEQSQVSPYTVNMIAPTVGGPALELSGAQFTIDTAVGYIAGGGGGGGAGAAPITYPDISSGLQMAAGGAGGAGGGKGGDVQGLSNMGGTAQPAVIGGAGGAIGVAGANGSNSRDSQWYVSGSGGGRIVPGTVAVAPTGTVGMPQHPGVGGQAGGSGGDAMQDPGIWGYTHKAASGGGGGWGQPGGAGKYLMDATTSTATGGTGGNTAGGGSATFTVGSSSYTVMDTQAGAAGGAAIVLSAGATRTITAGAGHILGAY